MALDLVRQVRRLFILREHLPGAKPDAVVPVRPAAGDERNRPGFAASGAGDLERPAAFPPQPTLGRGDEQVQSRLRFVREKQVVVTVVVEVNEPQAVVASLFIDNRQAPRQREGELFPRFLRLGPGQESALFWVGYNQFTTAIPVHIAKSDAEVAEIVCRVNRLAVHL